MPKKINGQDFFSERELAQRLGYLKVKVGSFGVFAVGRRLD